MYYPIGWPKKLNFRRRRRRPALPNGTHDGDHVDGHHAASKGAVNGAATSDDDCDDLNDGELIQLMANTDRSLMVVLTRCSVHVWFCKPSVEIVCHTRDHESVRNLGHNVCVSWKPDSTMLVIQTSQDHFLFYKVTVKDVLEFSFESNDGSAGGLRRESMSELFVTDKIPSLYLFLSFSTKIIVGVTSFLAAEEEVVVCTREGHIVGVNWNGTFDPGFHWQLAESADLNVTDIKYSSMIGGFSLVFANGKVGFVPIHSHTEEANGDAARQRYGSSRVQYVQDIDNGSTSAINHKYQLIAFGLKNAEGILCCIDDENMAVNVTHRIVLPSNKFPDVASSIGAVACLQWSPDSTVLACSWERGGVALWSAFGALLMCSLSWDYGLTDAAKGGHFLMSSLAWAKEGFQLWTIGREKDIAEQSIAATNHERQKQPTALMQMSMAKSILASNPSSVSCCGEMLVLLAEDRLYLGVGTSSDSADVAATAARSADDEDVPSTNAQSSSMRWKQQPVEVGNHQWIVIQVPNSYLASNWPIRLAAVDQTGQHLAIAGRTGMAHYSLLNRRWKLFGNETQERDFEVCGGLLWWENYIVLSCYNVVESRFEIRAYPHNMRLDNQYVRVVNVPAEVLVMSMYKNRLLVLLLDGSMHLFGFFQKKQSTASGMPTYPATLHLVQLNQIIVSNLVVPPECVTSILLTSLHYETSSAGEKAESIIMNVCGRLFFLEKESALLKANSNKANSDVNASTVNGMAPEAENGSSALIYKAVSILASGVENVWVSQTDHQADRPHLTDALWLSRGCYGMNVWLPLLPSETERTFPLSSAHNFMSKRIMLPINTHIYPLAVLFRDAVVVGADNETMFFGASCPVYLPYSVISRTSQVYLHHILRELLKKNLGMHAWEIANSCSSLPYFPHSLELLLHETLEEEATSSQPIPDALLPRVVDFIREFPVFLETIVHCARKTELALWPHLFAVVGNPNELFQRCLDNGQLETAASYLLVLQNLERTSVSRNYVTLLMDAAKKTENKQLATDLTRFLQAIDPVDFESPPAKSNIPPTVTAHPTLIHSMKCVVSPNAVVTELDGKQVIGRKRTVSSSNSLLHSASVVSNGSITSVPNSPDATTAARSHSLSNAMANARSHSLSGGGSSGVIKEEVVPSNVHKPKPTLNHNDNHAKHPIGNGSSKQLIRQSVASIQTQQTITNKCNMANGTAATRATSNNHPVSSSTLVSNGAIPANQQLGDSGNDTQQSQSASQCTIS